MKGCEGLVIGSCATIRVVLHYNVHKPEPPKNIATAEEKKGHTRFREEEDTGDVQ